MVSVTFHRPFKVAGGPIYVPGDMALLEEAIAIQAIQQGAALRNQTANYCEGLDHPPMNKMVQQPMSKKG